MNETKNPSALRSKKEIFEALLRLMAQHPYEEITVKQIALEAQLERKTFYRNFTSKDDVLEAILDELVDEYKHDLITIRGVSPIEIIFGFCMKKKRLLLLFDKNNMMYRILRKLNTSLLEKHEELKALGLIPPNLFGDLDMKYLISVNVGAGWNVICRWVHEGMKEDPREITATLTQYIIQLGDFVKRMAAAHLGPATIPH